MRNSLKIAFFGSSLVSAYWNGAATYYRGIIRELNSLGHCVSFYEPDAFERQSHRDIPDPKWARVHVYENSQAGVDGALADASDSDLLVKASGVGVFDAYLESAVLEIKKSGSRCIFWDVDAPATLDRMASDKSDPFRALVPRYDMILTYGGGTPVVQAYTTFGARRCIPIYNALDPSTHFRVEPDQRFSGDLGFLRKPPAGQGRPRRGLLFPGCGLTAGASLHPRRQWMGRQTEAIQCSLCRPRLYKRSQCLQHDSQGRSQHQQGQHGALWLLPCDPCI